MDVDDNFTISHCMGLLFVDIVLYGLITWYVDAVKPGKYGVAKPFYFPFTVSTRCACVCVCVCVSGVCVSW